MKKRKEKIMKEKIKFIINKMKKRAGKIERIE